jgi:hypothetical protein
MSDLGCIYLKTPFDVLLESLCDMVPNQAFFVTKIDYISMGPPETRPGDQVWVLYGGRFNRYDTGAYESYTALSYAWGELEAEKPVYRNPADMNGAEVLKPLIVTHNLADTLHHITKMSRYYPRLRRWWIDALCIKQDDEDPEKTYRSSRC